VRPDEVSLGVLVAGGPAGRGRVVRGRGSAFGWELPAYVTAYLTMAMCLFTDDDYTEIATKVTGSLSRWGCWNAGWSVPTASGITQARKRLGPKVLSEVFEQVAGPVADTLTRGAWLRRWRLLPSTGSRLIYPTPRATPQNSATPGGGIAARRSRRRGWWRWPSVAHTRLWPPRSGPGRSGRKPWLSRLYQRLRRDELLTADRNFLQLRGLGPGPRSPTPRARPRARSRLGGWCFSRVVAPGLRCSAG
jgi:transposase IS4-like protein